MRWNMRLVAAQRGIWKASDLLRLFAEHGLVISAGKMSGLWSGKPVTNKLADLDVICVALGCQVGDLLIPEPDTVARPGQQTEAKPTADATTPTDVRAVIPRRRDGRSLPPR
jgi:DNA-binding Xre family transcriptional regulator